MLVQQCNGYFYVSGYVRQICVQRQIFLPTYSKKLLYFSSARDINYKRRKITTKFRFQITLIIASFKGYILIWRIHIWHCHHPMNKMLKIKASSGKVHKDRISKTRFGIRRKDKTKLLRLVVSDSESKQGKNFFSLNTKSSNVSVSKQLW